MANGIMNKEDLLRFVRDKDVKIINLWFTDILGMLKSFGITTDQLEEALDEGSASTAPPSRASPGSTNRT